MPSRRNFLQAVATSAAASPATAAQRRGGAKDRIGVGLIGCGNRGSFLGRLVEELGKEGEKAGIVAVCDIYRPRREKAAQQFSAKAYRNSTQLLNDRNVDAVIVATPDRVHAFNSLEAVRAGKDVYCEKPLTHWRQFDRLKELVKEARASRSVFQVGAQWVSDPVWLRAAEMVSDGAIGKPIHAQCGYFRHGDSGERGMPIDDPNAKPGRDLNWDAFQADAPQRPFSVSRYFQWRMYADYSGGPSTDLYPHPMTRLFKVLGVGLPKKVVAVGGKYVYNGDRDVPDTFDLLIEYPEGLTVAVLGTIANETGLETVVRGTEATLTFDQSDFVIQPQRSTGKRRRAVRLWQDAHEHMRNFLTCIRSRETPNADIELSYRVQVPLIMSMLSWEEGKVAYFDASDESIRLG